MPKVIQVLGPAGTSSAARAAIRSPAAQPATLAPSQAARSEGGRSRPWSHPSKPPRAPPATSATDTTTQREGWGGSKRLATTPSAHQSPKAATVSPTQRRARPPRSRAAQACATPTNAPSRSPAPNTAASATQAGGSPKRLLRCPRSPVRSSPAP